jgi:GNAT superfamily N-acetyltransferase
MLRSTTLFEIFTLRDADALAELSSSVGWRDTASDWRVVLSVGHVVGVREGNVPIAVAARFAFGRVWSLGKVIVHPDHQGRGLARAIIEYLLAEARTPDTHVTLVATRMGEPVYRRLGFRPIGTIHKLIGPATSAPITGHEPLTDVHMKHVLALDQTVFGGDRSALVSTRVREALRGVVCNTQDGLAGYATAVQQGGAEVLGPVIAPNADAAMRMVRALLTRESRTRRMDVPSTHERFVERLVQLGFRIVDVAPVMTLHGAEDPGDLERRFALASQAFG